MTTKELLQLYLDAVEQVDVRGWPAWPDPVPNGVSHRLSLQTPDGLWEVTRLQDGLVAWHPPLEIDNYMALCILRNHVQEAVDAAEGVEVFPDCGQWVVQWTRRPERLAEHLATCDPDGEPCFICIGLWSEWYEGPGAKDKAYLWAWRWMDADDVADEGTNHREEGTND